MNRMSAPFSSMCVAHACLKMVARAKKAGTRDIEVELVAQPVEAEGLTVVGQEELAAVPPRLRSRSRGMGRMVWLPPPVISTSVWR